MAFFLRFTNDANADLKRGVSYHYSDFAKGFHSTNMAKEKAYVAEMFGCDVDDIEYIKEAKCYAQSLGGLCGFELEADNLEDAKEEAKEIHIGSYSYETMKDMAFIFEGRLYDSCPEGVVFVASKIIEKI